MRLSSEIALLLVPVLPLLVALAGYALRSLVPRTVAWLGAASLLISALLSGQLLMLGGGAQYSRPWFTLPDGELLISSQGKSLGLAIPFQLDATVAQLLFLLTTALIAAAVLIYAVREREGDPRARQFYSTLTLFAGSMLLFICADTLLVLYLAWELMGVCSYLLIAHRGTAEARRAARQAFWTTRATDTGLLFAVLLVLMKFKWATVSGIDIGAAFNAMAQAAQAQGLPYQPLLEQAQALLGLIALLLLLACIGKAAQLPLSFWLPDAMVAPAPVSALLHAATMVAAGPFLLVRFTSLFQPVTLPTQTHVLAMQQWPLFLAVLAGGLTLVLGGLMALHAQDPKRVLAYSTVSQLGLVVMAVGALSEEAGLYHLLAHAWFKAALFLAVGYIVLRALQPGRDGTDDAHGVALPGLRGAARQPLLRWTLLLAGLSLAGIWPLAGALGKEQVLHGLLHRAASEPRQGYVLGEYMHLAAVGWWIGAALFLIALPVTAAYITRLIGILCFSVAADKPVPQADIVATDAATAAVAPAVEPVRGWALPLNLTAALAGIGSIIWAACYFYYRSALSSEATQWKWGAALSAAGILELVLSQALVWAGVAAAWRMFVVQPGRTGATPQGFAGRFATFFQNGMYLREAFTLAVGRTGWFFAMLAGRADIGIIDWLGLRCGMAGRLLAGVLRWVDDHVVDGVRRLLCATCWWLKRLHAHTMQNGQVQHYMLIILLAAVILCFAALGPLGKRLVEILGSR